jgi:tRNA modification GTPase
MTESVKQWQQQSIDVVPMTGARCKSALANAAESLAHARQATLDSAGEEIVASELRLALEQIAEVAGTVANNDILDALFSRFCIGK